MLFSYYCISFTLSASVCDAEVKWQFSFLFVSLVCFPSIFPSFQFVFSFMCASLFRRRRLRERTAHPNTITFGSIWSLPSGTSVATYPFLTFIWQQRQQHQHTSNGCVSMCLQATTAFLGNLQGYAHSCSHANALGEFVEKKLISLQKCTYVACLW